jgi:hypothetical protein
MPNTTPHLVGETIPNEENGEDVIFDPLASVEQEPERTTSHDLPFFVGHVLEALDKLQSLQTKRERWQGVDVAEMRATLAERTEWARSDLPKSRKRAA